MRFRQAILIDSQGRRIEADRIGRIEQSHHEFTGRQVWCYDCREPHDEYRSVVDPPLEEGAQWACVTGGVIEELAIVVDDTLTYQGPFAEAPITPNGGTVEIDIGAMLDSLQIVRLTV